MTNKQMLRITCALGFLLEECTATGILGINTVVHAYSFPLHLWVYTSAVLLLTVSTLYLVWLYFDEKGDSSG